VGFDIGSTIGELAPGCLGHPVVKTPHLLLSPLAEPCTQGIWMWLVDPTKVHPSFPKDTAVLLLDTEVSFISPCGDCVLTFFFSRASAPTPRARLTTSKSFRLRSCFRRTSSTIPPGALMRRPWIDSRWFPRLRLLSFLPFSPPVFHTQTRGRADKAH